MCGCTSNFSDIPNSEMLASNFQEQEDNKKKNTIKYLLAGMFTGIGNALAQSSGVNVGKEGVDENQVKSNTVTEDGASDEENKNKDNVMIYVVIFVVILIALFIYLKSKKG
jgi:hypothetical protein